MEDNKTNNNDMRNDRVRSAIYPMAGFYLIYQAYCMYKEISVTSGNEQILMIVFSILFSVIGLALMIFGFSLAYKYSKKPKEQEEDLIEE